MNSVQRSGSRPAATQSANISRCASAIPDVSLYSLVSACQSAEKKKHSAFRLISIQFFTAPW